MSTSFPPSKIGGGATSPTASAIVAQAVSGSHVLTVDGYSRTMGLGTGKFIKSGTFDVRGHSWCILYYPDRRTSDDADWISIYLCLVHTDADEVKAQFKISLVDQHGESGTSYSNESQICAFRVTEGPWGFGVIKRKDLEGSVYLKDDVLRIRCDVTVSMEIITEHTAPAVLVPPSDMHHHLARLLSAGEGSDVTFEVGGEAFPAHRYMLAARSSVFRAELLGPMKEKTATRVQINDMDANVFRALLHFIYTDSLPEMDDGDSTAMAQHLLVAADRYDMERLKLICVERLCSGLCRSTVATTLALAEQHGCGALKKACFKFLTSPGNLKAAMASEGFQHLRSRCPSLLEELLAKLAP
ncbi:BTB/POZ and MATH domain-containing protein 2-like [Triticum dicoccoides]|uniref:BTB/POZ and MATH domain-containing protein 2-like n=1 Tax=Triticum dicoccoides TaxID=85692 RepID=UPI00188F1632|nr:BTB/POZ and MATH domain-containing protein 2-like [Triticum dicoccoides]